MKGRFFWIFMMALLLAACASPPDVKDMVVGAEVVGEGPFPEALQENIAIASVAGGEKTSPLWTSEIGADGFQSALVDSLKAAGLFNADRDAAAYQLIAVITDVQQPLFGFDMTVTATVEYRLIDSKTGEELLSETLSSDYTATVGQAFLGVERLKVANEGAARENIGMLLQRLRTLNISP